MKRVLIISPHFPPVNAPDCQRVRMSLPYYRQFGWEPEVLAVYPRHRHDWHDPSLLESLPRDIPVHYCDALPGEWTRLVGIHNLGLRCLPYINRAAQRLLASRRFDLVFFSTTQFMVAPLGMLWRKRFGVAYIIDIQDPWRSNYYERPGAPRPPGGWKYQFARLTAWLFEERTYRNSAGLISVSHHYFRELAQRYSWVEQKPRQLIPFGGPTADFEQIAAQSPREPFLARDGNQHWVAAGSLGPSFGHALRVLFSGLKRAREKNPAAVARLRLHFIGTSYAPPHLAAYSARPIAETYGVADLVEEIPHRIGYMDSLRLLKEANGLLLLGSDDPAYSPSKIYPYYLADRPIISLVHHDSLLRELLRHLNCAHLVSLLTPGAETKPAPEVGELLLQAASATLPSLYRDTAWFSRTLTAEASARRQCAFFSQLSHSIK